MATITSGSSIHTHSPITKSISRSGSGATAVIGLKCKECGARTPAKAVHVCPDCFGPLEVEYDYDLLRSRVTRASIEAGPDNLWRYRDLLPVSTPITGFNSGWTPLRKADRLGAHLGVKNLYIKDDSANYPTWSYKERVVSVALSKAVEFGFTTVGCASTGNLANSVAAHAAGAGLKCVVFIPHDLEQGKVLGSLVFGPEVVRINGNYDDVNRLCTQVADHYGWAIVNVNLRPYYTEGAKTYGFEIAEQLGWKLPANIVCPVAGGTILPKIDKAFREFVELGLVEDTGAGGGTKFWAAQAAGCDPVVDAIRKGTDEITPQKPHTIARSIAIGNPADGWDVARVAQRTNGGGASVSDQQIVDAIKLLARFEGIFTEPAGGTTLAAYLQLLQDGKLGKDEPTVVCITGNGLKTLEAVQGDLDLPTPIDAKLSAVQQRLDHK
jgi:threonine synthase